MGRYICEHEINATVGVAGSFSVYSGIDYRVMVPHACIEVLLDGGSWTASASAEIYISVVGDVVIEDAM